MKKLLLGLVLCSLSTAIAWADGAVYAKTNALGNNEIIVYKRASSGNLTQIQKIATGGGGGGLQLGAVDSLGSAGSIELDPAHHLLFAVNPETAAENNGAGAYKSDCNTGTITSFTVGADGRLTFVEKVSSGGLYPNSLAIRDGEKVAGTNGNAGKKGQLLYVLNAGGPGACNVNPNITGFMVDDDGHMTQITAAQDVYPGRDGGSVENCATATAAQLSGVTGAPAADFSCGLNPPSFPRSPANVRFTPDGNQLTVTVKGTNSIYVFPVGRDGRAGSPTVWTAAPPAIPTYFGTAYDKNDHLLVAEVFGASTAASFTAGALSSFNVTDTGSLQPISTHVGDGGAAACWVVVEPKRGDFAYVSNNLSDNISSYSIAANGAVALVNANAAKGSGPNDMATVQDGASSFLYVLYAGSGTVGAFQINSSTGALTALTGGGGLPSSGAEGLTAY